MKIYVDIDNTICKTVGTDYSGANPIEDNIRKINNLFEQGNEIIYWTARGYVTGINHYELTLNQLKKWNCKFHSLSVGEKPDYDLLICDKTKRIEEL
tara:strand:+ start:320 stop:610 length:291 start_codon:yes stop_codon:yes gene_type:complete